jgi:hypothetical protein
MPRFTITDRQRAPIYRQLIREESIAAREACRDLLDVLDAELEGRRQGACA